VGAKVMAPPCTESSKLPLYGRFLPREEDIAVRPQPQLVHRHDARVVEVRGRRSAIALIVILSIGAWGFRATVAGRTVFRDVLGDN
jgi:hypothetical protein